MTRNSDEIGKSSGPAMNGRIIGSSSVNCESTWVVAHVYMAPVTLLQRSLVVRLLDWDARRSLANSTATRGGCRVCRLWFLGRFDSAVHRPRPSRPRVSRDPRMTLDSRRTSGGRTVDHQLQPGSAPPPHTHTHTRSVIAHRSAVSIRSRRQILKCSTAVQSAWEMRNCRHFLPTPAASAAPPGDWWLKFFTFLITTQCWFSHYSLRDVLHILVGCA